MHRVVAFNYDENDDISVSEMRNKMTKQEKLENALKATLLFHMSSHWDETSRKAWKRLTGRDAATTRTLCDFIRETLADVRSKGA